MESSRAIDRIKIVKVDITRLKVDAIVNAANSTLLGGGGVDGAIHRAAGPALRSACQLLQECETGQAKYTEGFNLKAKYIIHTVGPRWYGGKYRESDLLASCYQESMKLAIKLACKTIAFPAISCGIYDYPVSLAAEIAIREVLAVLRKDSTVKTVYLSCFDQDTYAVYKEIYNRYRQQEYEQRTNWAKSVQKEDLERKSQVKALLKTVTQKTAGKKNKSFPGSLFKRGTQKTDD